jgi:HEAT repeats
MPDPPKPDPRAVEVMKRLRIMERWKEDAWAHGKGGTEALCAILKGRQFPKTERLMAAGMLGYAKTNLRAQQCLTEVAITRGEDPQVRWAAMFALNAIGGPYAMSALSTVFINIDSSKVMVPVRNQPSKSLGLWALEFLYDLPEGRSFLEEVASRSRRGQEPMVWSWALVMLFDDDPPRWSRVVQDVVATTTEPLPLRKIALELLIYLLTDSHFASMWDGRSAWDSVASISLAKSDPRELRSIAESAMKRRPRR